MPPYAAGYATTTLALFLLGSLGDNISKGQSRESVPRGMIAQWPFPHLSTTFRGATLHERCRTSGRGGPEALYRL